MSNFIAFKVEVDVYVALKIDIHITNTIQNVSAIH
jgi:hypothetical protein